MVKIAVLASFNMDLVIRVERRPEAGETLQGDFAMHLGGKGFNQAVAARRLGADVVVCGRVGDDEFGRRFLGALDEEGIDRRAVVVDPVASTGVATIYVEPDGTNTIVQSPNANHYVIADDFSSAGVTAIDYDIISGTSSVQLPAPMVGIDATLTCLETNDAAILAFHEIADLATGSVDEMMLKVFNAAPARTLPQELRTGTNLVVNMVEASSIAGTPCATIEQATLLAHKLNAVITLGERGAVAPNAFAAAYDVPVVDTTGAGDAFCGALAVRLAEGAELADAMRFANAAGALACTKHGAYPSMPYRADVEALIAQQGSSR
jgi:ribokinase